MPTDDGGSHGELVKRVKVHVQMIIENAADPYHIPPVHHGYRPETTSFVKYLETPSFAPEQEAKPVSAGRG